MTTAKADRAAFETSRNKTAHDQALAENMATSARVAGDPPYGRVIREILAETGHIGKYDPRHLEAFIRVHHSTLDHLSRADMRHEVHIARECVDIGGIENAELAAQSYGF